MDTTDFYDVKDGTGALSLAAAGQLCSLILSCLSPYNTGDTAHRRLVLPPLVRLVGMASNEMCMSLNSEKIAEDFISHLDGVEHLLSSDLHAALDGDPAATCGREVILCYPGFFATSVYRTAHVLYRLCVPLLPRLMTEYAHRVTGIDIHPGAEIGESFFIDHGTGVVIGETAVIGNRVRLYQGVTLGAKSIRTDKCGRAEKGGKRHPTVEDDVIIYAGATVIGGDTVIGRGSVIGAGVFITSSVEPNTTVTQTPECKIRKNKPQY
jgi:serine O-acetyltransferase